MREIKFRLWNDYDKKMLNWSYLLERNLANIFTLPSYKKWLMQYVGLKDKNGKEIYEGDIVKVVFQGEVEKYHVLYDESNTCFRMFSTLNFPKDSFCDFTENETDLYEVIGNIYENPELLEDK